MPSPARQPGLPASPGRYRTLVRLRRLCQIVFFLLFLFLLLETEFRGSLRSAGADIRLSWPVSIFLQADPLVAVATALSSRALYKGLLWSLVVLLPTFFLGRFFCGWICPLGTLCHFFSNLKSEKKRGKQLVDSNRYKGWQRLKYYILIALLAAALFGSASLVLMDPLSLSVRSLALSILPALNYALNALVDVLYKSRVWALKFTGDAITFVLGGTVLSFKQPYFRQGFFLGLLFIAILALNLRVTRFWCRALCPLGALLGAVSRWSILGMEKHPSHCEDCNRCLLHCQGGDDPIPGVPWRKAECHLCLNCVGDCPESGIRFRFFPSTPTTVDGPNLQRRKALAGLAAGAAALPLFRSAAGLAVESDSRLVRPPGALAEKAFLERCIRCGECMKACPNDALHPSLAEAGWEGLWTPVLVSRIGYCEPTCTLCGQVCPTGAIWEFTSKEKGWVAERPDKSSKPIKIGTAFYDHGRCLPWSMATDCIVCEEWCPTSPKSVYLRPAQVVDREGNVKQVRQPYIDPELCIGCGACEYACPVQDRPAIYVTSIGESRSRTNQILLKREKSAAKTAASLFPQSGEVPGWTRSGETRTFEADKLYEYVDGDDGRYLRAGVIRTLTTDYKHRNDVDAVVDIHLMKAPSGARKILTAEPAEGSQPLALGDVARHYGQSLTFSKGPYFVRLIAYREAPGIDQALLELARAVEKKLGEQAGK